MKGASAATLARFDSHNDIILRMARLSGVETVDDTAKGAVQIVLDEATLALPLADLIDVSVEKQRLTKEIDKVEVEIKKIAAKLANENFVAKAPPEVVEENQERKADAEATRDKLSAALQRLAAV